MSEIVQYKIAVCGSGGSGKTTFCRRVRGGEEFKDAYVPTIGAEVIPRIYAPYVVFNIWDLAGKDKFRCLADGYLIGTQAGVVFWDGTQASYLESLQYIETLKRINGEIPIVVCRSFSDLPRDGSPSKETWPGTQAYLEISGKNATNLDTVLTTLGDLIGLGSIA